MTSMSLTPTMPSPSRSTGGEQSGTGTHRVVAQQNPPCSLVTMTVVQKGSPTAPPDAVRLKVCDPPVQALMASTS